MKKLNTHEMVAANWGRTLGFRITKPMQEISNIRENTRVRIVAEPDKLTVTRIPDTLERLFADWDGEEYDSYDWGELEMPAGKEMI